jgi:hypothetical protein
MAFSFPSNPTLNDTYTFNNIVWTFNGKGWSKAAAGGGASITVNPTVPATTVEGSTWLDNDTGDLYVYTGGNWLLVNSGGGGGSSFSGSYTDLTNKPTISATAVSDQANTSTGYFDLPVGTTAQRPATPEDGNFRINTTTGGLEVYYLNAWTNIKSLGISAATGGLITTDGSYKVHTFTSSGTFVITQAASVFDILLVAGGGGGGHDVGGGGGAGGLLYLTGISLDPGSYAITVGAGGAGSGRRYSGQRYQYRWSRFNGFGRWWRR